MDKACRWPQAKQCFTTCCCHTPAETLAWAQGPRRRPRRDRGVRAPCGGAARPCPRLLLPCRESLLLGRACGGPDQNRRPGGIGAGGCTGEGRIAAGHAGVRRHRGRVVCLRGVVATSCRHGRARATMTAPNQSTVLSVCMRLHPVVAPDVPPPRAGLRWCSYRLAAAGCPRRPPAADLSRKTSCSRVLQRRRLHASWSCFVVIAVVGTLVGLLLPAVQSARETSRRTNCGSDLRSSASGS